MSQQFNTTWRPEMCLVHLTEHVFCRHPAFLANDTHDDPRCQINIMTGDHTHNGKVLVDNIDRLPHMGMPCCAACLPGKEADIELELLRAQHQIREGFERKKYGFQGYEKLMAEAKSKSEWMLKLINTPVRKSGWDAKAFKALKF